MNRHERPVRRVAWLALVTLATTPLLAQPPSEAAARAFLRQFLDPAADHAALSAKLRPTRAEYDAVFSKEAAAKLFAAYDPAWQQGAMVVKPNPGQTELLLWSATTDDLRAWRGNASEHFPGGYKDVAAQLKPGQTLYSFKFVAPGQSLGMAFDGLVYLNGSWRIFPKPWRALR